MTRRSSELAPGSGLTIAEPCRDRSSRARAARAASIDVERRIDRPELEISGIDPDRRRRRSRAPSPSSTRRCSSPRASRTRWSPAASRSRATAVDIDDVAAELRGAAPAPRRVLVTTDVPAAARRRDSADEGEPEPVRRDAAQGGRGRRRRARHDRPAGGAAAAETFAAWGIPADGYVMSDGSGLSRYNYVSPATITTILARLHGDPRHRDGVRRDPADRRQGRHDLDADAPHAAPKGTRSRRPARSPTCARSRVTSRPAAARRSRSPILANDFVIPSATVNWIADLAVEILANFSR